MNTADVARQVATTWPPELAERWIAAHHDETGVGWKPVTIRTYGAVFGRYLSAAPTPEVTPAGLRAFIRGATRGGASARSIHGYVHQLLLVATLLWPGAVRVGQFDWLYRTRERLANVASRTPKQRRSRMVSAVEIVAAAKCGIAAARQMSGWRRVQHFRDGLALLLAVWVPERRRALVGISLRDIDMEASTIRFSPDRMKTGESRIRLLPSELAPLLAEYITLRGVQTHDALLIGKGGRPLGGAAFYAAACRTTERYMGRRLPPHFFRNGVAIALVEADPNRPDLAQVALGHRSATTTNHYTESATSIAACRHLTSSISQAGSKARQRL